MPRPLRLLAALAALSLAACVRTAPAGPRPVAVPVPEPVVEQTGAATEAASLSADVLYLRSRQLLVPVAEVRARRIIDSFDEARDGGRRVHRAVDILAPRGTPVLAADDGAVLRLARNTLGGITIYATDPARRIVYYYAHLDRYHAGLAQGQAIQRGDTLGYVGTTGNAPKNEPHLHFQIMRMAGEHRYWDGEPINPYPLLVTAPAGEKAAGQ